MLGRNLQGLRCVFTNDYKSWLLNALTVPKALADASLCVSSDGGAVEVFSSSTGFLGFSAKGRTGFESTTTAANSFFSSWTGLDQAYLSLVRDAETLLFDLRDR